MPWEQTPNNSGNGSKTRRSSCNSSLLSKESGAQGQEEIQEGAVRKAPALAGEREEALVEEQAQARVPGRAQEAVRKAPAAAGELEAAPEAGSVPVPVPGL